MVARYFFWQHRNLSGHHFFPPQAVQKATEVAGTVAVHVDTTTHFPTFLNL